MSAPEAELRRTLLLAQAFKQPKPLRNHTLLAFVRAGNTLTTLTNPSGSTMGSRGSLASISLASSTPRRSCIAPKCTFRTDESHIGSC